MAKNLNSWLSADEDYIDMDISSSCLLSSSPQSMEFEFQMSSTMSDDKDSTTSPADELFYKGKLLPLHLPPRLQMVQKLLESSTTTTTPFFFHTTTTSAPSTNTNNTPSESWNISPTESCRVSCELNPAEYFFEWSTELRSFVNNNHPKKSWSKKLRLIKQYSITQKLKASRMYLKSMFNKSACSDESCTKATCNLEPERFGKVKECSNKFIKVSKKTPFGYIGRGTIPTPASVAKSIANEGIITQQHRKSFSGAINKQHYSPSKCLSSSSSTSSTSSSLSSSFSMNSNVLYDLQFLRRSSSATSEIDGSIEEAIKHCKSSQQPFNSRITLTHSGISLCDDNQEKKVDFCNI